MFLYFGTDAKCLQDFFFHFDLDIVCWKRTCIQNCQLLPVLYYFVVYAGLFRMTFFYFKVLIENCNENSMKNKRLQLNFICENFTHALCVKYCKENIKKIPEVKDCNQWKERNIKSFLETAPLFFVNYGLKYIAFMNLCCR